MLRHVFFLVLSRSDLHLDGSQRVIETFPRVPRHTVRKQRACVVHVRTVQIASEAVAVPPATCK